MGNLNECKNDDKKDEFCDGNIKKKIKHYKCPFINLVKQQIHRTKSEPNRIPGCPSRINCGRRQSKYCKICFWILLLLLLLWGAFVLGAAVGSHLHNPNSCFNSCHGCPLFLRLFVSCRHNSSQGIPY